MALFPPTRASVIAGLTSAHDDVRRHAINELASAYWRPAYQYLRVRWRLPREDAEDLTQDVFARAAQSGSFARYDSSVSRFRTYLRVCLDSAVKNAHTAAARRKRGGRVAHLSIDAAGVARAEGERDGITVSSEEADECFRRECVRALFALALDDLRAECALRGKQQHWLLFERYELDGYDPGERPTYAQLGAEFGLPTTQVTNHLAYVRRELRRLLFARLRSICSNEIEFREEARHLLGQDIR